MRRVARWAGIVAAVGLLGLAGAVYWLFYDGGPAPGAPYRLDLAEVRAAAARLPGPLPRRIEVETLSHDAVPHIAMTSGTDWGTIDLIRTSYRVVGPGGSVVIDSGHDLAEARTWGFDRFDAGAYQRVQQALLAAGRIVVTHEHADHLGGVVTSPALAALVPKLRLSREQLTSPVAVAWPAGVRQPNGLVYATMTAILPGVVLIRAPGHTPGSQLIYVRLADGREYLFLGDVASLEDNVTLNRQRSRYVTSVMQRNDRSAIAAQLAALRRVIGENPALVLVPGHDAVAIDRLVQRGMLRRGFRFGADGG